MLSRLRLHHVRCFGTVEVEFGGEGLTVFTGANAQGKTTLLEAVCVLLRLQSPRATGLGELVRHGSAAAAVEGDFRGRLLRVVMGEGRRTVVDGHVVGRTADYLRESGLVVWMGNDDIQLVRGAADGRRRFLDFAASQMTPGYLEALRGYERALRARNFLLKAGQVDERQLQAYGRMLVENGAVLTAGRRALVECLAGHAVAAQREIGGSSEELGVAYADGSPGGLAAAMAETAQEERRRRATVAGPHRDDLTLSLHGMPAGAYASEGQQRTIALALKVAQARVLAAVKGCWPVMLLDDIFGELDPGRRHCLLEALPAEAQKLATTTSLGWLERERVDGLRVLRVEGGAVG